MADSGVSGQVRVLVGSPLEPDLIEKIRGVDPRLDVTYRPELLGTPRFPGDHTALVQRTATEEAEWARLMADAEIMFDVYRPSSSDLPHRAPRLKWIQFSSSGVGGFVQQMGLADSSIIVTNAAGIHATPLAEFVMLAMLYFAKEMPKILADQRQHRWERLATRTLRGKTLGIIGLGSVGREAARLANAAGMRVLATKRTPEVGELKHLGVEVLFPPSAFNPLLEASDYLVLSVPLTPETKGLIGETQLSSMKRGAVLINISRGDVIDEAALIRALQSGPLRGAALDVFAVEPPPQSSPLWDMPNVLVTPHSMSTAVEENEEVVDLFTDNLRRYLAGQPLRNVFDRARGY